MSTSAPCATAHAHRPARLVALCCLLLAGLLLLAAPGPVGPAHAAAASKRVLIYTGTTGYRHAEAIDNGRGPVQNALAAAGYTSDWEDCNGFGTGAGQCRNADENPRVFTRENLSRYDAVVLFNVSDYFSGTGGTPGQLWNAAERAAIIDFVQNGGGIVANHNATDMGAGQTTWNWWDGGPDSVVGTTMTAHSAGSATGNAATVQVADRHHLATRNLPDTYQIADEHYNYARNVRGTHHVLATFDERSYNPGSAAMGQDHPISWCKVYDGDAVNDGTGEPKPYADGRTWVTGMGHYGVRYTENGGDNHLVKHLVGGIRWAAGEGLNSDCGGTVWKNFQRTVLVNDVNGPVAIDVAADGKVYWTEIGPTQGPVSEGFVKVHDPQGAPNNRTTVATIPTRADHGNSEDGVLGMSLEPGFDLGDPGKRDIYVYYSPRHPDWPTTGNNWVVGYNVISRFTLNAAGTAVVPGSEREILRVDKAKISGSPSIDGTPADSGPGHVGGASLVFDSEGSLYLGVGDDVSPNASGHSGYPPLDHRARERRDARKTSANSGDLRGKVLRIDPREDIPEGTAPGEGKTYEIPAGNMFDGTEGGGGKTRREIYAMGFRQPFTLHADPAHPGTVVVGEYCHDNNANGAQRGPAGVCEWNLIDRPAFHGWPFCMGNNSAENTAWRWNYTAGAPTASQYDCSLAQLPAELRYAPAGGASSEPTNNGLDTIPGPAAPATIWKKYAGATGGQSAADFGDLSAGGMQPVTGPVYRYGESAGQGAFPRYYDGSWLITNRGADSGFWKEVRLRSDNNRMLRVHDWLPINSFGAPNNSFVIPTRFGPDGALYMGRWTFGCCRNQLNAGSTSQIFKIEFTAVDECLTDDRAPQASHKLSGQKHPDEDGTYVRRATLGLTASDVGCAGLRGIEYRVNGAGWEPYSEQVVFDEPGTYTVDYRATDKLDNTSAPASVTFEVVQIDDQEAPAVTAAVAGTRDQQGNYMAPATLTLEAEDRFSGITSIEHRANGGDWVKAGFDGTELSRSTDAKFERTGLHRIEYRATDSSGNTSAPGTITFAVIETTCDRLRSDEFDGNTLNTTKWPHVRVDQPGYAATVKDGRLILPTLVEVDGTATGPLAFVSQPVPDGNWSVVTRVTPQHVRSWQQAGLMLWQSDGNFVKAVFSRNSDSGARYFELTSDNPNDTRQVGPSTSVSASFPATAWIRLYRDGNTIGGEFAPDVNGAAGAWQPFGSTRPVNTTPPRAGQGVRVGPYAGSDFGGAPYAQTAAFDFVRFEPDERVDCVTPPDIHAQDAGDATKWVPEKVQVNAGRDVRWHFGARQGGAPGATRAHDVWLVPPGGDPRLPSDGGDAIAVSDGPVDPGGEPVSHTTDREGSWDFFCRLHSTYDESARAWKGMTGTIEARDGTAPRTTASLAPSQPGPGGEYTGRVAVRLEASDGANGTRVAWTEHRIDGGEWKRTQAEDGADTHRTEVVVTDVGARTVEFRSADGAGNVEAAGKVAFTIKSPKVLIYTGTTGYRHADAISQGVGPLRDALTAAGIESVHEDCDGMAAAPAATNCNHPSKNPRIFNPDELFPYNAIFLFNASSRQQGAARGGNVLWDAAQRRAIVGFVNSGGGIAANHNSVDMGHAATSWDWWDGPAGRSAVGSIMPGHAASSTNNLAPVEIEDAEHPSTAELGTQVGALFAPAVEGVPSRWLLGDEHYNFATNVRGAAHVLATLDESTPTYNPGSNRMGDDHPISWCKPYDGGRVWLSGIGHFGSLYTANEGDNNVVRHLVGGVAWAAGARGSRSDCDYADTLAPQTTHALDPAQPDGTGGRHAGPVKVTLTAIDDSGHTAVAGVVSEYRVDGGQWQDYRQPFTVSQRGRPVSVEYRSRDRAGNLEDARQFSVEIEPAVGDTHEVKVDDDFFTPERVEIRPNDLVRWDFDAPHRPHDIWIVEDGQHKQVTNGIVFPGSPPATPVQRGFQAAGTFPYYCSLHGYVNTGMSGTISVTAAGPEPPASGQPAAQRSTGAGWAGTAAAARPWRLLTDLQVTAQGSRPL